MKLEFETYCGFPNSIKVEYVRGEQLSPRVLEIIKELQEMIFIPPEVKEQPVAQKDPKTGWYPTG